MTCSKCGGEIPEGAAFCPICGNGVGESSNTKEPIHPSSDKSSGFGIASMVLGICSVVLICIPFVPIILGVLGLVLGIVGLGKKRTGKGMAIAGISTSIVALVIWILTLFGIGAAVIPNIQRSRESKDLSTLDAIATASNIALVDANSTGKGVIDLGTSKSGLYGIDDMNDTSEENAIRISIVNSLSPGFGIASSNVLEDQNIHIFLSYDLSNIFYSVGYSKTPPEPGERVDGIPCKYSDSVFEINNANNAP